MAYLIYRYEVQRYRTKWVVMLRNIHVAPLPVVRRLSESFAFLEKEIIDLSEYEYPKDP